MDPIKTIGKLLNGEEQRDAIHIAILPVIVDDHLSAGDTVKFVYGSTDKVRYAPEENSIGVIDPFLEDYIPIGSRVWLFLKPNSITGIRHEWTHPAVDNPIICDNVSERWLREFADKWNFDYDQMIATASSLPEAEWGNYITARGKDLHDREELGEDHDLFWAHLELLVGKQFNTVHREKVGWTCSC